MEIFRYTPSVCPNCGRPLNAGATPTNERPPEPGDVAICMDCRHVGIYAEDMHVRNPTDKEVIELAGDNDILLMLEMLRLKDFL